MFHWILHVSESSLRSSLISNHETVHIESKVLSFSNFWQWTFGRWKWDFFYTLSTVLFFMTRHALSELMSQDVLQHSYPGCWISFPGSVSGWILWRTSWWMDVLISMYQSEMAFLFIHLLVSRQWAAVCEREFSNPVMKTFLDLISTWPSWHHPTECQCWIRVFTAVHRSWKPMWIDPSQFYNAVPIVLRVFVKISSQTSGTQLFYLLIIMTMIVMSYCYWIYCTSTSYVQLSST